MSLLRDITAAIREGMDDLLNASPQRDGVDEVLSLLEADLTEARAELDVALRDEQRLKARIDQERRDAERIRERAQQAVSQGDDELGRELVRRRRRTLRGVEILEQQWSEHQELLTLLERHIDELEDKLQETRLRGDFLRTRHRVIALRERYEQYRREYGLDHEPLESPDDEIEARLEAEVIGQEARGVDLLPPDDDDELDDEPERLAEAPGDRPAPPEAREGRGELPPESEPQLVPRRRRRRGEAAPEPEYRSPWEVPARDIAIERERMLRDIERRHRDSNDADIEAELRKLKGEPEPEPTDDPPPISPEPAPAPPPAEGEDDGPDGPA